MCRLLGLTAGREPISASFWLLDAPDSLAVVHVRPDLTVESAVVLPDPRRTWSRCRPGPTSIPDLLHTVRAGRRAGGPGPRIPLAAPGGTRPAAAMGAETPRGRRS
jgi:hypothetical protein